MSDSNPRISLVVAVARNGVIGRAGDLPWRLPADLRRFRQITTGHTIVMGRRTWESIGRPLPDRVNIVLSTRRGFQAGGCQVEAALPAAIMAAREAGETEVFVIGGAAVYREALPSATRIHLTRVHADVDGDVFFPPIEGSEWTEVYREEHGVDARHAHPFAFTVLERA